MAMQPKKFRLDEIEARVANMYRNSPDDIDQNAIGRIGHGIFAEMDWLCKQLRKQEALSANPPPADKGEKEAA